MKKFPFRLLFLSVSILALPGCSAVAKLTIQEHKGPGGEKVVVGQYMPEEEYACAMRKSEQQGWGVGGYFNPMGTRSKIIKHVVASAPEEKANYVYMDIPGKVIVMGIPVNIFSDAEVTYYHCKKVPG